jgi:hypothetical protein
MEHVVDLAGIKGLANVLLYKLEVWLVLQMLNVGETPGKQAIDDHNIPVVGKEGISEV